MKRSTHEDAVRALIDAIEQMRAIGASPSSMEIEPELYDALRVAVPTPSPAPDAVPMFNGVRFTVKKKCGLCGGAGTWVVNSEGGYGRREVRACTNCLRGEWRDMVPRLLDSYPFTYANLLRIELGLPVEPPIPKGASSNS